MVIRLLKTNYIFFQKLSFPFFPLAKNSTLLNCVNKYRQNCDNSFLNSIRYLQPRSLIFFRHNCQMDENKTALMEEKKDEDSIKTAAQLKKDAKKLAKLEKFAKKQESKPKPKVEVNDF